jgi:hypothetical protein
MNVQYKLSFASLCDIERQLSLLNISRYSRFYDTIPGTVADGGAAVIGFAGHHFIGDGTNHWESQYIGRLNLTEEALASWVEIIRNRQLTADQLGIKIIHLVAPEKQSILPDFRWMQPPATSVNRPIRRIVSLLSEGESRIFYPEDLLRSHAGISELCWRGDSHWCTSSVCLVAESIAEQFGCQKLSVGDLQFKRTVSQYDLLKHFHEETPCEESIMIAPIGTMQEVELWKTEKRHIGSFRHIQNPGATSGDVLVIFCDSYGFGFGLDYALSYRFKDVYVHWLKELSWDYVRSVKATHVIWQCAERFLGSLPSV